MELQIAGGNGDEAGAVDAAGAATVSFRVEGGIFNGLRVSDLAGAVAFDHVAVHAGEHMVAGVGDPHEEGDLGESFRRVSAKVHESCDVVHFVIKINTFLYRLPKICVLTPNVFRISWVVFFLLSIPDFVFARVRIPVKNFPAQFATTGLQRAAVHAVHFCERQKLGPKIAVAVIFKTFT